MFNANSGYIGKSRSVRSQQAIDSYEVPLSMISKSLVDCFLDESEEDFSRTDLDYLKKVSIKKWKYVAQKRVLPSSWHHTSSYFNKTHHYDVNIVAEKILEIKESLDVDYKTHQESQKKEKADVKYGVIKVQVWGGSRKRPKLEGYEEAAGIIVGDWLFYKENHCENGGVGKYKTAANKVEWVKVYETYADLVKNHKEYKKSKKIFNKLILEKAT